MQYIRFQSALFVLALLSGLGLWASSAYAQGTRAEFPAEITGAESALKALADALDEGEPADDAALVGRLAEIKDIRAGTLERIKTLTEERELAAAALEQATPEEGSAADPLASKKLQAVQSQREDIDGLLVRANLNASAAEQLTQALSDNRKAAYFSTMFERTSPPFAPRVRKHLWDLGTQVFSRTKVWLSIQKEKLTAGNLALRISVALLSFIALLGLASPLYSRLELFWLPRESDTKEAAENTPAENTPRDKFITALLRAGIRLLVFAIPALIMFALLYVTDVIGQGEAGFVFQIYLILCGVMFADGIALGLLSPTRPALRLATLSDRRAGNYRRFGIAAFWVFALDRIANLSYAEVGLRVSLEAVQAQSAIVTLLASALVLMAGVQAPLISPHFGRNQREKDKASAGVRKFRFADPRILLLALRYVAVILAITGIAASLIGYVELGRILIWVLILTVLVVAVYMLVRHALSRGIHNLWDWLWVQNEGTDDAPEGAGGFILTIWLRLLADLVLIFAVMWVFFRLANFQVSDLDIWVSRLSEGLPIGLAVIKFKDIAAAFFAFAMVLLLFRGVQAYIRRNITNSSTISEGAGASVLTLVGYLGFIIALFVGFSALGLAWSNIALIAGALSVGIGFGLQGVVNNFVSGLILLFERPINIGDWVATTAGEGKVRHIGLRSTEIRSFDRASILIPNSDLITSPLTNWTHKDKTGRVKVKIGVSYDADPEKVREILLQCATEQRMVLRSPEPFVYWKGFGESSLDFELRVFIRNIINVITVETELRFDIFKALKAADIKIPFPQRDVNLVTQPAPKPAPKAKARPGKPTPRAKS